MGTTYANRIMTTLALGALLVLPACDRDSTSPDDHGEMAALEVIDRGQTGQPVVATWTLDGGWDGASEIPAIDLESTNQRISIGFRAYNENGVEMPLTEDGEYSIRYRVSDQNQEVLDLDHDEDTLFHGDHVHIYGAAPGTAQVHFILWHVDHADRETAAIDVTVVGEDHGDLAMLEVIDRGQTAQPVVATWDIDDGWDGEIPAISLASSNQRISIGFRAYDADGHELELSEEEEGIRYRLATGAPEGILDMSHSEETLFHGDHVHIYGAATGTTQVHFILWHDDHAEGETTAIDVTVVD